MTFWRSEEDPGKELHKVLISRGSFSDPKRDRDIPYKIYRPAADNLPPLPVIVWSHGLGGSREGAGFLNRYIASHGYLVLNVQHRGTDSSLWEGKPGHPWDVIRAAKIPRRAALDRYQDIPFALDQMPEWAEQTLGSQKAIDWDRIGMSGHSFGANTTQIMGGQMIGRGKRSYQLKEPRFKAGILYSPIPAYNRDEGLSEIYGAIDMPLFHMTGTADESPLEDFGWQRRKEVFDHSGAVENHFLALQDGDHMVFAGSRGQLAENLKRQSQEEIIKIASLAFWDAYLRDDKKAANWLTGHGFIDWMGENGLYEFHG